MTLGEFRALTKDMRDEAEITITINSNQWVHPGARYIVNNHELYYDGNPFESPTSINLECYERL